MGNTKQVVVLIFLILVLGWVVWFFILGKPSFTKISVRPRSESLEEVDVEEVTTEVKDLTTVAQEISDALAILHKREKEVVTFTYRSRGRRDPMVPLVSRKVSKEEKEKTRVPGVLLTGIVWDKHYPLAIVNDRVVKKGDVVEGAKILRINPDGLVVLHNSKEFVIKLHGQEGQEAGSVKEEEEVSVH